MSEECCLHGGPAEVKSSESCPVCALLWKDQVPKQQKKVEKILGNTRLGLRFKDTVFDDYKPTCTEAEKAKERCFKYAETFKDRLLNCDNILMLGKPGTGKNMLSAAICNHIAKQEFIPLHTTAMKLVRRIKDGWNKKEPEQEIIDFFSTPDLLVIDEVGVQFGSKTEELLLFEVINERYENKRPTIIISNLSLAEVVQYLGFRIIDRFYEGNSAVLEFTWESYRRRQ